jgi:hypothetical protein
MMLPQGVLVRTRLSPSYCTDPINFTQSTVYCPAFLDAYAGRYWYKDQASGLVVFCFGIQHVRPSFLVSFLRKFRSRLQ